MTGEITLLPGCADRPWLRESPPKAARRFGNETRDERGRVRVTLYRGHPHANRSGAQWRYRLAVAYALNRPLRSDEHVDHADGSLDRDDLSNLRLLAAEYHGQVHALLIELAGYRSRDGRFAEHDEPAIERACRFRWLISSEKIRA